MQPIVLQKSQFLSKYKLLTEFPFSPFFSSLPTCHIRKQTVEAIGRHSSSRTFPTGGSRGHSFVNDHHHYHHDHNYNDDDDDNDDNNDDDNPCYHHHLRASDCRPLLHPLRPEGGARVLQGGREEVRGATPSQSF
jgi:hypothetical protein